jgi:quercetin dioxygenase-like cupin family protein
MSDFVIRSWRLDASEGDQAPLHVHHGGEEAFICLDGQLQVEVDGLRQEVDPGTFIVVPRGAVHTFASPGGAHVLAVMGPEIAELIDELHEPMSADDRKALWGRYHSSLVDR